MKPNELRNQIESLYAVINDWNSKGTKPLLDMAYPQHDGNADGEAVAELMLLRQSLNTLSRACEIGINHISNAIND